MKPLKKSRKAMGKTKIFGKAIKSRKTSSGKQLSTPKYLLRLYVVGNTPNCISALKNLKVICDEHLSDKYEIEVIDLLQLPQLAKDDGILAIPTVTKRFPKPMRKAIGDLSNTQEVLSGLGLLE